MEGYLSYPSYQRSRLEIVWVSSCGAQGSLYTGGVDVKTVWLMVEEPGPVPMFFHKNLFAGSRQG